MPRRAGEAVVAALEFEIGIADSAAQEAQQRVAMRARGHGRITNRNRAVFQMDSQHALIIRLHAIRAFLLQSSVPLAFRYHRGPL
jgi:hypothetical protein